MQKLVLVVKKTKQLADLNVPHLKWSDIKTKQPDHSHPQ
jgi:hypothetical protein